jgi:hypothetical protein
VLLLLALLVSGCGSYCTPNRHVRDRLDESVLLGTWRLTEESLKLAVKEGLRRDASQRYTITFNADHTCGWDSVLEFDGIEYEKAPCSWKLEHDVDLSGRKVANFLDFVIQRRNARFSTGSNFAREDGVLILWEYYSDPDLWEFLEYKKAGSKDPAYN